MFHRKINYYLICKRILNEITIHGAKCRHDKYLSLVGIMLMP